jgi:hypothetical protein
MNMQRIDARLLNIDRRIEVGLKDTLQLVDPATREATADVKRWNWRQLNPMTESAPTYEFQLAQDVDIVDLLPTNLIAFNGRLHDVVVRDSPNSVNGIIWTFKTRPTNELIT